MKDLLDKIILFICCFTVYLLWPEWGGNVTPVLIAVIIGSFLSYFDQAKVRTAFTAAAVALSLLLPGLTVFLPMICYDLLLSRYQWLCLSALVPLVPLWHSAPLPISAVTTMLLLGSGYFKYRAMALEKLKNDYYDMRDTTRELAMQLKQQNLDLLEKQDYEINIATLNERNRIAREIHDNVGHLLSSSILQVGALLTVNKDELVKGNLLVVKDTLDEAMNRIRASVHDLHDESIDLYAQIFELVKKFTFCKVDCDYDIKNTPNKKTEYAFISIVREALSNIIKHSDATLVSITFREHPALYQLIISDNGTVKSFDMESGIGLKNITERIDALGGNIHITIHNGFHIFISVPKEVSDQ